MSTWPAATLGEILAPAKVPRMGDNDYPILSITMHNGLVLQSERFKKRIASLDTSQYKVVGRNQLVVAFPIDEAVLDFQTLFDRAAVSPAYAVWEIRPEVGVDLEYLRYFLRSPAAIIQYIAKLRGTTARRRSLTRPDFESVVLPLPPYDEQKRIVQTLTSAQVVSRRYDNMSASLAAQGSALFRKMFGHPVRDWPVESKKRVSEVGRVQLGRQRAPKYQSGQYSRPYMRVANVLENRISLASVHTMDFDNKDFSAYKLEYGDILLNEGQSTELVGRPAIWRDEVEDCCFQNTLIRFQADQSSIEPEYALWLFLELYRIGEFAKISSKTSNLAHLGSGRFGDMTVPVPPLNQQKEFVQQITKLGELADTSATAQKRGQELFASLQYRAFLGSSDRMGVAPANC